MVMMIMLVVIIIIVVMSVMGVTFVVMVMMVMRVTTIGIGTAFRLEGGLDLAQSRTQTFQHRFDGVIGSYAHRRFRDFDRHVPPAEMPGQPCQRGRVGGANLHQVFCCGDHFNEATIVEFERVTTAQKHGMRQIEHELQATNTGQMNVAALPIFEIKQHAVNRRCSPAAATAHFAGTQPVMIVVRHAGAP